MMLTKMFTLTDLTNGKTKTLTAEKAMKFLMKKEGFLDWEAHSILSRVNCLNAVESDRYRFEKAQ